jgi:hypothetical protein
MVSESLWAHFHREWRRIDRDWRTGTKVDDVALRIADDSYSRLVSSGMLEAIAMGVNSARDELRVMIRKLAPDFPGTYLVPV